SFLVEVRNRELVKIVCQTFGLYFIIQMVVNGKDAVYYLLGISFLRDDIGSLYFFLGLQVFNFIFNGIAAWLLFTKSEVITNKLVKDTVDQIELNISKVFLIELVIIAISFLVIVFAVPEILNTIISFMYFNPYDRLETREYWTDQRKAEISYS